MCQTKYISSLFIPLVIREELKKEVQVSMKRSDGEIFTSRITLLTEEEADKVRRMFSYFEELRTCLCTKYNKCEIHNKLNKGS